MLGEVNWYFKLHIHCYIFLQNYGSCSWDLNVGELAAGKSKMSLNIFTYNGFFMVTSNIMPFDAIPIEVVQHCEASLFSTILLNLFTVIRLWSWWAESGRKWNIKLLPIINCFCKKFSFIWESTLYKYDGIYISFSSTHLSNSKTTAIKMLHLNMHQMQGIKVI